MAALYHEIMQQLFLSLLKEDNFRANCAMCIEHCCSMAQFIWPIKFLSALLLLQLLRHYHGMCEEREEKMDDNIEYACK